MALLKQRLISRIVVLTYLIARNLEKVADFFSVEFEMLLQVMALQVFKFDLFGSRMAFGYVTILTLDMFDPHDSTTC